jgi:hypothetical protein
VGVFCSARLALNLFPYSPNIHQNGCQLLQHNQSWSRITVIPDLQTRQFPAGSQALHCYSEPCRIGLMMDGSKIDHQ